MRSVLSNTLTHVQGLIQLLGPASPWIESLIQEESDSWTLQSSEGLDIAMYFSPEPSRIFLTALLGHPEQAHQHAIYTTMLSVNLLHAENHSLRVALTGPNGAFDLVRGGAAWDAASVPGLAPDHLPAVLGAL
jgi:hypothetical protein